MEKILEYEGNDVIWIKDVCKFIENDELLESSLKRHSFKYKKTKKFLFASIEDVIQCDKDEYEDEYGDML